LEAIVRNRQQRRFVVLRSDDARARAAEGVTRPDNLRRCAVAVAIVVVGDDDWALFDAGRAAQNMMIAAQGDGLVSCPNAVADRPLLDELVGVGEGERLMTLLSFGHRPAGWRTPEDRSASAWLEGADRAPLDVLVRTV
jgi:hypothetical protein